jgi:hypothetical protein
VLLVAGDERAHLEVPYLNGPRMQAGGQQGQARVEGNALDPARLALELGQEAVSVGHAGNVWKRNYGPKVLVAQEASARELSEVSWMQRGACRAGLGSRDGGEGATWQAAKVVRQNYRMLRRVGCLLCCLYAAASSVKVSLQANWPESHLLVEILSFA